MSELDVEVEKNDRPFSEKDKTEQNIASFISQCNLDQDSQFALFKVFANNYSPVKVQQLDDDADLAQDSGTGEVQTTRVSFTKDTKEKTAVN